MIADRLRGVGRSLLATSVLLVACGPQEYGDPGTMSLLVQGAEEASPACGSLLTSSITLTEDITCPSGFTGTVFTLGADGITFDGAGHTIDAPEAQTIFSVEHKHGVTIRNVITTPGRSSGNGLFLHGVRHSTFSHIQVSGRTYGINGSHGGVHDNAFTDNTLSGNYIALHVHGGEDGGGGSFSRNDLSHSQHAGLILHRLSGFTVTGDNNFSASTNGMLVYQAFDTTIENLDFPADISNTALAIEYSRGMTVRNITAHGRGPASSHTGLFLRGVRHSTFSHIQVSGRTYGINGTHGGIHDNAFTDNTLSGNYIALHVHGGEDGGGGSFSRNDLSHSQHAGLILHRLSGFTVTGDNNFSASTNGMLVYQAFDTTIENLDFPADISNTALAIEYSRGMTVRNITAHGRGPASSHTGLFLRGVRHSTFSHIQVSGRTYGINGTHGGIHDNAFTDNTLSGNYIALHVHGGEDGGGGSFSRNDLSHSQHAGLILHSLDGAFIGPSNVIQGNGIGVSLSNSENITITGNVIQGNTSYGVQTDTAHWIVDARNNYWGHSTGPLDRDIPVQGINDALGLSNPGGQGNAVTDFILYSPYCLTPTCPPPARPDLVTSSVAAACDVGTPTVTLTAQVRNQGDAVVSTGLQVAFYRGNPASGGTLLGVHRLTDTLPPGGESIATLQLPAELRGLIEVWVVADDDGTGQGREQESHEDNNASSAQVSLACSACIEVRLSDYNVFLLGDYSLGTDVQGKVAAGGNITLNHFAVGAGLPDSNIAHALVAGGNLTLAHGGVWGDAWYGGSYSADSSVTFLRGSASHGAPINFAAMGATLRSLSSQLAGLAANGTMTRESWGGVMLRGTDPRLNVFQVPASAFTGAALLSIEAPAGSLVVINISGATAAFTGFGHSFSGGIDQHGVLYNFVDATSVTAHGFGFWGTILAPRADISFSNGSFDGGIYARSLTGSAEGHINPLYDRDICP
jgi:choice-of-anchor A domain-containing protein